MSVSYLGMIQSVVRKRREQVEIAAPATLSDLLDHLAKRYGPGFRQRLVEGDRLTRLVTILIDGQNCLNLGELAAPLSEDQQVEVVLFGPPIAGG